MADISSSELYKGLQDANGKLHTMGILSIILGLFCIIFAPFVSASITLIVGCALMVSGVFHIFNTFSVDGFWGKTLNILASLLAIWAGVFIAFHPVIGGVTIINVCMIYFMVIGFIDIISAFQLKPLKDWWVGLVVGFLNLTFAIILVNNPEIAAWIIGLLIGVSLFLKGMLFLSLSK